MKINFSATLADIATGQPITDNGQAVSLAKVSVNALMAPDDATGEDKLARYLLATRVVKGGEVEATAEEAALLKRLIGKSYGPLIVGQCWPLLDGGR